MSDFAIRVKVLNARILTLMRQLGIRNQAELARRAKCQPSEIGLILNLKVSPLARNGEYRKVVLKIADALRCEADDLFCAEQKTIELRSNEREVTVRASDLERSLARLTRPLLDGPEEPEKIIDAQTLPQRIKQAMEAATLTAQERAVLCWRFEEEKTLHEAAELLGVGSERVRYIEGQALRKLRKPKAARFLENRE